MRGLLSSARRQSLGGTGWRANGSCKWMWRSNLLERSFPCRQPMFFLWSSVTSHHEDEWAGLCRALGEEGMATWRHTLPQQDGDLLLPLHCFMCSDSMTTWQENSNNTTEQNRTQHNTTQHNSKHYTPQQNKTNLHLVHHNRIHRTISQQVIVNTFRL